MKKIPFVILFFLIQSLCFSQSIRGFHIPDSLKTKSFNQLEENYNKVFRINNKKAGLYANVILAKGKKEKNENFIYDGYYKIAHIKGLTSENGHPYADSLIEITKNVNNKEYPAKAYILKGILLNYEFEYKEALNYYIKAQQLSKDKNLDQFFYIKKLIGILKTATGENEDALPLFLEYYNYQKQKINTKDQDIKSYIGSIFSVANCYNKAKQYIKAQDYINIGIHECNKYKDYTHYPYFISGTGIVNYYLKNYKKSIDSHLEAEKSFVKNNDYWNLAITYYFLGKNNYDTHHEEAAVKYFIKTDSVLSISRNFDPITRDSYEILIDYYKKKGDKKSQLKFIDKLFFADSIINNSKQYLSKEIYKKYDTPILIEKKEQLIADLNSKNSLLYIYLAIGTLIIFVLLLLYIQNVKKIAEYKKQANKLLEKSRITVSLAVDYKRRKEESNIIEQKGKSPLSDKRLQDIKMKLELFENNKEFLRKNITVDSLAKDFDSNRDYLSKSVNELKEKNFSQYLNELRINYIVEELNKNDKLRKYTISAIADDIGYNNSESFSNAFRKITGTLPSYYIKLLREENEKL
ncbi:helix-turn-helix domain-containing protein [Chryseobacterium paludis]|uniref:helix-turn-helix domain-containing protein n=1 Tax=Chryseobacterium paludis TaxID=2956784 RepID=UPI0021C213BD|nr:helix-turn-helix domain-containing protein [Chryseobacterium paludis]